MPAVMEEGGGERECVGGVLMRGFLLEEVRCTGTRDTPC